MDIIELKYFYTSAEFEHITKASTHLHIAQPALTKSIKKLEDELNVKLFYRKGRNVYLTEYGKYLKQRLDEIMPLFDNLALEVSSLKKVVENTITLNVLSASSMMTDIVIAFKKIYPETIFKFVQNEENRNTDILITTTQENGFVPNKNSIIFNEEIMIAFTKKHRLNNKDIVTLKDLAGEEFISLAGTRHFRAVCDRLLREQGMLPKYIFESDSPVTVKNLIKAGIGIGFWPKYSWGKIPKNEITLKSLEPNIYREIVFEYLGNSAISKKFYTFINEYLEDIINKNIKEYIDKEI